MTQRQKRNLFGGTLLLIGTLLIGSFFVQMMAPPQPIRAQEVLVEATAGTIVVDSPLDLANLRVADGQTVLIATVNGGSLLIYDDNATDTVNNSTVYDGPNGVGRFKAFSLSGISAGVPAIPADPDDINPAEYTVVGTGVTATDTAAFNTGLGILNAAGGGVMYISGTVSLNQNFDFTAPISLIGVPGTDPCILQNDTTGAITWNSTSNVLGGTSMSLTATAAFADHLQITTASNTLVAGDWFYAFSDDPVNGVTHNAANGNNPGEVHQVKEVRQSTGGSDYVVFDDYIVDALTNGPKVVELSMFNGITVSNIKFKWTGTTPPAVYGLLFRCCSNVLVTNCHWVNPTPNEVHFQYCGNVIVTNCSFESNEAYDTGEGYHVVVTAGNGFIFSDSVAYGARHVFTTAGQTITETGSFTTDSGTEFLTSTAHGHENGTLLRTTATGGLSSGVDYFVVGKTSDTFQLSLTLGGSAVNLTSNASGTWTNIDRQGTPRNVLVKGVLAKQNGATNSTLVPFDTHAEGWGIVFDGCVVSCPSEYQAPASNGNANSNRGFQTRARNTLFKDCTVYGSSGLTPGIYVQADDCQVLNCNFKNCWYGVRVRNETGGGTTDRANACTVQGCLFDTLTGPGVSLDVGANHNVNSNEFFSCASSSSSILRAPINIATTGTGIRVRFNSLDNQASNKSAIGGAGATAAGLSFVGNDMTGYAADGATFTASAGTDTFTSASHGLVGDEGLRLTNSGGALPTGVSAGVTYYVVNRSSSTFQLSLSVGGAPVPIDDAGSGTHTWDMTTDSGFDWRNTDAANLQTEADSYNWTD